MSSLDQTRQLVSSYKRDVLRSAAIDDDYLPVPYCAVAKIGEIRSGFGVSSLGQLRFLQGTAQPYRQSRRGSSNPSGRDSTQSECTSYSALPRMCGAVNDLKMN